MIVAAMLTEVRKGNACMKIMVEVGLLVNEPVRATLDAARLGVIVRLAQELRLEANRKLTTDGTTQLIEVVGDVKGITSIVAYMLEFGLMKFNVHGEKEEIESVQAVAQDALQRSIVFVNLTPPAPPQPEVPPTIEEALEVAGSDAGN